MVGGLTRVVHLAALALGLALAAAGCVDRAYLASAKDQYESRHHLKKEAPVMEAAQAATEVVQKEHRPYRDRECDQCHEPDRAGALRAPAAELCRRCHPQAESPGGAHDPHRAGCTDCHVAHESPFPYHTKAAVPELCLQCHEVEWSRNGRFREGFLVHRVVHTGGCLKCHLPHGGTHPRFLRDDPIALCLQCHDPKVYGTGVVHGPLAVGDCLVCHDPHASRHDSLLKVTITSHLCFECHSRLRLKCVAARRERDCLRCHQPHPRPFKLPKGAVP